VSSTCRSVRRRTELRQGAARRRAYVRPGVRLPPAPRSVQRAQEAPTGAAAEPIGQGAAVSATPVQPLCGAPVCPWRRETGLPPILALAFPRRTGDSAADKPCLLTDSDAVSQAGIDGDRTENRGVFNLKVSVVIRLSLRWRGVAPSVSLVPGAAAERPQEHGQEQAGRLTGLCSLAS
jgi:hypothetical protein